MVPRLNIRQKIILGLLVPSLCLGALTAVSYRNLQQIEEKTYSLEFIDDIENIILEFRRQEKNFLLYGEQESYALAIQEVDTSLGMLDRVEEYAFDPTQEMLIGMLRESIAEYRECMVRVFQTVRTGTAEADEQTELLRDIGKELVDQAQRISNRERRNILTINGTLRSQLLFTAVGVSFVFAIIFFVVSTRVLSPLRIIEQATTRIARGEFEPLEVRKTNDEIRQVQVAFNRMVTELERRQDQLVQAQKLSSIGTLSAGIAHQVNNPLNNISTSAQILRGELGNTADAFALRMLDNIDHETARARDIVRGLLEFARHTELSIQLVSLRAVVDAAVRLVSSQIPPGVCVTVDVPDHIRLYIDPQRMGEVLLNLILNAIQAIESLPGSIRLYTDAQTHFPEDYAGGGGRAGASASEIAAVPPSRVTLVVEDTGKGIAPDDLPHIFDPFFTRKEVGQGTGLGLSVAYGIIEEFHGRIRAESVLGKGTRFCIDLPLPVGSASEAPGVSFPASVAPAPTAPGEHSEQQDGGKGGAASRDSHDREHPRNYVDRSEEA